MNDDFNVMRTYAEKPDGLDKLQALIHHCSGIYGYFCAHRPVRVLERVSLRLGAQLLGGHAEKRAAGGRENYLF